MAEACSTDPNFSQARSAPILPPSLQNSPRHHPLCVSITTLDWMQCQQDGTGLLSRQRDLPYGMFMTPSAGAGTATLEDHCNCIAPPVRQQYKEVGNHLRLCKGGALAATQSPLHCCRGKRDFSNSPLLVLASRGCGKPHRCLCRAPQASGTLQIAIGSHFCFCQKKTEAASDHYFEPS